MSEREDDRELPAWRWSALSLGSVLALIVVVYLLYRLRMVLLVFIASLFLAYVLDPPVRLLSRIPIARGRTVGRHAASAVVVLLALAGVGVFGAWFVPALWSEVHRLITELPDYVKRIDTWMLGMSTRGGFGLPAGLWAQINTEWHDFIAHSATAGSHAALSFVSSLGSFLGLLVIPVGAYYLLSDGVAVAGAIENGLPASWRPTARRLFEVTNRSLTTYVRGQTLVVVIMAVLCTVLFTSLGVRNALALGVLAGFAEAVPFLGALLVEVSIVAMTYDRGWGGVAWVLVGYFALNQVNNYFISPRLMGSRLEVHPFLIILAVLAGSTLGGLLGAMLALPATAVIVGLSGLLWGAGHPAPPATAPDR